MTQGELGICKWCLAAPWEMLSFVEKCSTKHVRLCSIFFSKHLKDFYYLDKIKYTNFIFNMLLTRARMSESVYFTSVFCLLLYACIQNEYIAFSSVFWIFLFIWQKWISSMHSCCNIEWYGNENKLHFQLLRTIHVYVSHR